METIKNRGPMTALEVDEMIEKSASFTELWIYYKTIELGSRMKSLEEKVEELKSLIARKV